jgi:hypothetical protein
MLNLFQHPSTSINAALFLLLCSAKNIFFTPVMLVTLSVVEGLFQHLSNYINAPFFILLSSPQNIFPVKKVILIST